MAEHPNVARVTRALEARARGKFDEEDTKIILDAFADDAVWHMSGAWSDVKGKDALLAQWLAARSDGAGAEDSLRLAVAAGAASVLEVGAGRFDPAEAKRLTAAVEVHELQAVA